VEGSEEGANGTLVKGETSTEHSVDIVSDKVDEAELGVSSHIDLINLANNAISNDVILQVRNHLGNTTRSLAQENDVVALGVLIGEEAPVSLGTVSADLLDVSLGLVLVNENDLVAAATSALGTKIHGSAIGVLGLSIKGGALQNERRELGAEIGRCRAG
jgi:hypothetical protein